MSNDAGRGLGALVALIGIGAFAGFAVFGVTSWGRGNQRVNCEELADFLTPRAQIIRDEVASAKEDPDAWRDHTDGLGHVFGSLRDDLKNPKLYRPDDAAVKAKAEELQARLLDYKSAVYELDGTFTGEELLNVEAQRVEEALTDLRGFCVQ